MGLISLSLSTSCDVSDWMFMLEESASCALAGGEGGWRGKGGGEWADGWVDG
jgi:hypothetical protein